MNCDALINEVYSRPAIWDCNVRASYKRASIDKMWCELAETMGCPRNDCKKKWKYLRDRYRIELKKKAMQVKPRLSRGPWLHYNQMKFVKPFISYANKQPTDDSSIEEPNVIKPDVSAINARRRLIYNTGTEDGLHDTKNQNAKFLASLSKYMDEFSVEQNLQVRLEMEQLILKFRKNQSDQQRTSSEVDGDE